MPVEIKKGDKIRLVNPMGCFTNIGEVCEVTKVDGEEIQFKFGGFHLGCMSHDEFAKYFVKCEEPRKVSEDDVKRMFELKTQKSFEDNIKKYVITRAEKAYLLDCIKTLGFNDYQKISFCIEYTGMKM